MTEEKLGTVIEVRPKLLYRVRLADGSVITAQVSSKMRHATSRLIVGDRVLIRVSQNDPHRGQITRLAN